jgi:hypothetical protein
MLDRRWNKIEFGALADCGSGANKNELTTDIREVTCKVCIRIYKPENFINRKAA